MVVRVNALIKLAFEYLNLSLHFEHFGLKLSTFEGVKFFDLFLILFGDLVAMFLDPEELALVLLEQTRVVVDFALEDLVGRLVEDGRAENLVNDGGLL